MKVLILGASGKTGRLVVKRLMQEKVNIKIIVRDKKSLCEDILSYKNIEIIEESFLNIKENKLINIIEDCNTVVSCLGHKLNLKGIYGNPRKLVRDSIKNICNAIEKLQAKNPIKIILMNSSGNINYDENEKVSFLHNSLLFLIRTLVPPHLDNELAANFLRTKINKQNKYIQWSVIRPDSLINEQRVSKYKVFSSPIRSALLDAGKTSRINVADFISSLILNEYLWKNWKYKMPVIYNKEFS